MKTDRIKEILKGTNIIIPRYLLSSYRELKLNERELVFLSVLISSNDDLFDPIYLSGVLGWKVPEVMEVLSSICDKNIIALKVRKEKNKMEEYIDLDNLFNKLVFQSLEDAEEENHDSKIYEVIETELGRTLSPIECETISGWLNSNISEELIKEALKEAILNGVHNLKYIDRILFEWNKKGYKKASDVKKKTKKDIPSKELFEYDWLDEND